MFDGQVCVLLQVSPKWSIEWTVKPLMNTTISYLRSADRLSLVVDCANEGRKECVKGGRNEGRKEGMKGRRKEGRKEGRKE